MRIGATLGVFSSIACAIALHSCNNKASAGGNMHRVEMHDIKQVRIELDSMNRYLSQEIKDDSIYLYRATVNITKLDTQNIRIQR